MLHGRKIEFQNPMRGTALQDVLRQRKDTLRQKIQREGISVLQSGSDADGYIKKVIEEALISVPLIHFDRIPQPGGSSEVVRGARMWVVTYRVPCEGQVMLLAFLPRSGAGFRWPEVYVEGHTTANVEICFEVSVPDTTEKNIQPILDGKKEVLDFLRDRLNAIMPEVVEYNAGVESFVRSTFEMLQKKFNNDRNLLAQL